MIKHTLTNTSQKSKERVTKILGSAFHSCLLEQEKELGISLKDLSNELTVNFIELLIKSHGGTTFEYDMAAQSYRVGLQFKLAEDFVHDNQD